MVIIRTKEVLQKYLQLTQEEELGLEHFHRHKGLPLGITSHYIGLMDPNDPNDPLRLQVVPRAKENEEGAFQYTDPLGEEDHEVVPHLVHRYPDRVLLFVSDRCASYCRFCTRKRFVGQGPTPTKKDLEKALAYIASKDSIHEVILSGGDALILSDERLEEIVQQLRSIPHVQIIRLATRMLAFLPMRVTDHLVGMLQKYKPIYIMSHFNHPNELCLEACLALDQLADAGVVVMNQTVLLQGINDSALVLEKLFRKLVFHRARPYYLHQCDLVKGTSHFRVPLPKALDILRQLRGHLSGLCMPTFVVDIPGGYGKVPLVPNPIVSETKQSISLIGFDGEVGEYPLI